MLNNIYMHKLHVDCLHSMSTFLVTACLMNNVAKVLQVL